MAPWVASGEVRYREDIREGLEVIPTAFAEMLRGENFGKTLVRVAPDPNSPHRNAGDLVSIEVKYPDETAAGEYGCEAPGTPQTAILHPVLLRSVVTNVGGSISAA